MKTDTNAIEMLDTVVTFNLSKNILKSTDDTNQLSPDNESGYLVEEVSIAPASLMLASPLAIVSAFGKAVNTLKKFIDGSMREFYFASKAVNMSSFVADLYSSIKAMVEDVRNNNIVSAFFEGASELIKIASFVGEKIGKDLPFFGLAAAMSSFEAAYWVAYDEFQKTGSVSQDNKNDVVTNGIDILCEIVKTAAFFFPGVNLVVSTPFIGIADLASASLKTLYLKSVDQSKNVVATFWDEWLGNIDEMFADIGAFISEKITSKNYVANSNTVVDDKTGTSYTYNSDGTVTITQADGIRKIYNANSGIAITLSNGINRVSNYGSNVKITGSASNDTIFSHEGTDKNSFTAGRGDDYIIAYDTHSTIHGDVGNDKIAVLGDNNSIFGDADRDAILINPSYKYNTIRGGKGNDIIIVENAPYQTIVYDSGDGSDVIFGYDETDKLIINTDYVMTTGGGNVLITAGTGTITLVSASGKTIDINSRKINTATESSAASTVPSFFVPDFWRSSEWVTVVSASNSKSNVTLSGTSGADSLKNSGSSVLINSYGGNDTIKSTGSNVTVNAGEGNNSVSLSSSYAGTVIAGNGDDNVTLGSGYVSVGGGNNNVLLTHVHVDGSTIISGNGDDTINTPQFDSSWGLYHIIQAGGGNNYINNSNGNYATISADNGNDTIITGGGSSIKAGEGNNFITVSTSNGGNTILTGNGINYIDVGTSGSNTIYTGKSNDTIITGGGNTSIEAGSGNNKITVSTDGSNNTIKTASGNDYITINGTSGGNVIYAGGGSNTVYGGTGTNSTVVTSDGNENDYVTIGSGYVSVGGGNNNVLLTHVHVDGSTIISGDGDDTINTPQFDSSWGLYHIIQAGGGNNYINNSNGNYATISVGNGNDTIITGGGSSINAGSGNNHISITTSNGGNTILTGTGNDTISFTSDSNSNFIVLTGGNDIIQNYESNNTIKSVGIMTSTTTGDDIILTDGKNTITLEGARGKTVHTATISSAELIEWGLDTVPSGGDDSDSPFNGLDSDTKQAVLSESLTTLKKIKALGAGTAQAQSNGNDNDFANKALSSSNDIVKMLGKFFEEFTKWQRDSSGKLIYVKDNSGHLVLDADGKPIKIKDESPDRAFINAGFSAIINIGDIMDSAIKIAEGEGDILDEELSIAENITQLVGNLTALKGNPDASLITDFGSAVTGLVANIVGVVADGANKEEISGIIENALKLTSETINLFGTNATLQTTEIGKWFADNATGKKIAELVGNADNALISPMAMITGAVLGLYMGFEQYKESTKIYDIDGLPNSLALTDKWTDTFGAAVHTFANTVTGNLDDAAFNLIHGAVANITYGVQYLFALATGGDTSTLKVNTTGGKNYMEILGDGIKLLLTGQITGTKNDDTIYNEENSIPIVSGEGSDYIYNSGSYVQIYSGVGNDTVFCHENTEGNYVDGGNDDDNIHFYGSANEIHGGYGKDKILARSNGEIPLSGNIIYGEAGDDYIILSDMLCTVKARSNNTVVGGAGNDIISLDYTNNGVVVQYNKGDGNDAIYGLDANDTIKINKSDYVISTEGTVIKISVEGGAITLMDSKCTTPKIVQTDEDIFPVGVTADKKKTTLTVSNKFRGANIFLADYADTFTKIKATAISQNVSLVGSKAGDSIKAGKGDDTIYGNEASDTIYGGAGNDSIDGGTGNDKLYGEDGNDTISGGAGNDTLVGGKGNDIFVYENGSDFIDDYKSGQDKIKLVNSSISGASVSGSNIVLTTSKGAITVKGGKNQQITIIDSKGNETTQVYPLSLDSLPVGLSYDSAKKTLTVGTSYGGAAIDLKNYSTTTKTVDASKFTKAIKITGNNLGDSLIGGSKNDTLLGGTKADTLIGGKGNDTLTGGNGKDVFLYATGDGADVITDYVVGQDSIRLTSGTIASSSLKSSDVILKIGSGSITVKNAKDKKITTIDANNKSSTNIFANNMIFDSNQTAVTLGAGFSGTLKASDISAKTKIINATNVTKSINVSGNSQANTIIGGSKADVIYGGTGNDSILGGAGNDKIYGEAGTDKLFGDAGNDTIYGGAGNDTLTGGAGSDVFVYSSGEGKDIITDYTAGQDKIKITSGAITKTSYSGQNVVFTIGSGSLTVQNGKGKKITIIDSAGKTSTQTYSNASSGRTALWFADDDNFITNDTRLDSITEVNYSVGNIYSTSNIYDISNGTYTITPHNNATITPSL